MKTISILLFCISQYSLCQTVYHPIKGSQVGDNLFDFGYASFATLDINITSNVDQVINITLSEESYISNNNNGALKQSYKVAISSGTKWYYLDIPKHIPRYPNSQKLNYSREVTPFRSCKISFDSNIIVNDIIQQALYYDVDWNDSYFRCSDERLNKIYDLCKWTILANTFNGDFSSSERERQLYEGDSYIHSLGWYSCFNDPAPAKTTLEKLIYQSTWPTEYVMTCVFLTYEYYQQTKDNEFLNKYKDDLFPKTLIGLEDSSLLISTYVQTDDFLKSIHYKGRAGSRLKDMVDWPGNMNDAYDFQKYNTVENAYHYQALKYWNELYSDTFNIELRKIVFNKSFLKDGKYVDGIGSNHCSLHANLFALKFGLVPDSLISGVIEFIKSKGMGCSPFVAFYLLDALFEYGENEYAYNLLISNSDRSWLHMIDVGSTMTTEAWDIKFKPNACWNTAWSSSPLYLIIKWIAPNPELYNLSYLKIKIPFGAN